MPPKKKKKPPGHPPMSYRRRLDLGIHRLAKENCKELTDGEVDPRSGLVSDEEVADLIGCNKDSVRKFNSGNDKAYNKMMDKLRRDFERRDQSVLAGVMRQIVLETRFKLAQSEEAGVRDKIAAANELDAATKSYGEVGLVLDVSDLTDAQITAGMTGLDPDDPLGKTAKELCGKFAKKLAQRRKVSSRSDDTTEGVEVAEIDEWFVAEPTAKRLFEEWRIKRHQEMTETDVEVREDAR